MLKVICKLPNASELINDVRFVKHKDGMVSEEISEQQAERFTSIEGYELAPSSKAPASGGKTTKPQDPPKQPEPTPAGSQPLTPAATGAPAGSGEGSNQKPSGEQK